MDAYTRFLAVAEHRSISRAAQALHVSQPALSRTIAQLEEEYRTPLFLRTRHGVELSEAGKTLFLYASRAVRAIDNAREEIHHALGETRLVLRICSGDSWGYGVLPGIIRRFLIDHPDITITLDVLDHESRIRSLDTRSHAIAFAVVSPEMLASEKYDFEPLIRAPYDIYCDENHPLRRKARVSAEDLLGYRWIGHKFEYDYDPASALRTRRVFTLRTNAMLQAIEAMRGSQFLLSTAKTLAGHFGRAGIVPLVEDPESPVFVSGAITAREAHLRGPARKFLSYVRADLKGEGTLGSVAQGPAASEGDTSSSRE